MVEYYFLTPEEFRSRIATETSLEYEGGVCTDKYYGIVKKRGRAYLNEGDKRFHVDVAGGCTSRKSMEDRAPSVFIQPPGIRWTYEAIEGREQTARKLSSCIAKAEYELGVQWTV